MRARMAIVALLVPTLAASQGSVSRLEPGDCPFERPAWTRDLQIECKWLVAPESRERPNGRTVRLAVVVVRAQTPTAPPLVFLHGGPGISGIRTYLPAVRTELARDRDVVIYDQRGAGLSQPTLCPDYGLLGDSARRLRSYEEREKVWDRQERACVNWLHAQGIDPAAYSTSASAADLIDLRKALGYSTWNIYSGSYGARLAQEAMHRDPQAIRSVVLASPVARGPATQAEIGLSAQRALDRVWAGCAAQPACNAAFPSPRADFLALYDSLNATPIIVVRQGDTTWFDGRRLLDAIRGDILGRPGRLARLPLILHELRRGDRTRATDLLVSFDTSRAGDGSAQVLVHLVNCYDVYGPALRKTHDSLNAVLSPPFRNNQMEDCPTWQSRFADATEHAPVRSDIPVLIVTGAFDDRTPTEHARRIAATLTHVYLYEFPTEGHGARPVGCHLSILVQFYRDPNHAPDTTCIASIPPIQYVTSWDAAPRPQRP